MSSHSKSTTNFRKKVEFDTTLSAKMQGKSTHLQQTKVSPFKLQYSNDIIDNFAECRQLQAVKNINFEYVQLYNDLFKQNKHLLHLFDSDILNVSKQSLNRQQRYQLQCMKLLKTTSQNIQKLKKIRQVSQEWRKIANYIQQKYNQKSYNSQIQFCQNNNLIHKYQQNAQKLQQLQVQYKNITETNLELKDQSNLSTVEKQFKKTQRKLNKILSQQLYYQKKCAQLQDKLEQGMQKVQILQEDKLNLQMKIICQQGRKDKILRKAKRQKQKSIVDAFNKQPLRNNTRFTSLTK